MTDTETPERPATADTINGQPIGEPAKSVTINFPPERWQRWHRKHARLWYWLSIAIAFFIGMAVAAPTDTEKANSRDATITGLETDVVSLKEELADEQAKNGEEIAEGKAEEILAAANADAADIRKQTQDLRASIKTQRATLKDLKSQIGGARREIRMSTFEGTGIYLVGTDIRPGTYRAAASPGCYYERQRDLTGGIDSILDNESTDGPLVITVQPSDAALEVSNCGTFTRVGG